MSKTVVKRPRKAAVRSICSVLRNLQPFGASKQVQNVAHGMGSFLMHQSVRIPIEANEGEIITVWLTSDTHTIGVCDRATATVLRHYGMPACHATALLVRLLETRAAVPLS